MRMSHIRDFTGKHIHFIGIGGISMSGLAEILLEKDYRVSGSDLQASGLTKRLHDNGAQVYQGHDAKNIKDVDLVIYTAAVKDDNSEIIEAKRRNIPIMDRATLLGQIMETFSFSIGVAGTHGKTTTTSMLSTMMHRANLDPTILVGGELDEIGGNVRTGQSEYFITEACEYMDSFLKFKPFLAMILNIERDHLDYFKDIEHIYSSFLKFAQIVPKYGYVLGCGDDPLVAKLMKEVHSQTVSYGIDSPCDWMAFDISYDNLGNSVFRVENNGRNLGYFNLKVPGKHNIYNALASIAACGIIGIPSDVMKDSLLHYHGTHRRFELKGKTDKQVTVLDDYAHHPTEVKATITAAHNYPYNQLWLIYQPHTYTRTKELFQEFTEAFQGVDYLIFADIYAAREKDPGDISSRMLAEAIADKGQNSIYLSNFSQIADYIKEHAKPDDLVITMGAGNVYQIGDILLN
ncbi:MAG: UDP-N-acetylmuramate--L-alanine ligase [Clostridiales bacterium]|nr:UDP-N-acetylmuramate--L-alanine ligase [Clostridiales bacterium]